MEKSRRNCGEILFFIVLQDSENFFYSAIFQRGHRFLEKLVKKKINKDSDVVRES